MVSHALVILQTPSHVIPQKPLSLVGSISLHLFRNTIVSVKAVLELLAVLVRGVFGEQFAVCGALEGLEACFAFNGLGG